jgi:hypothetical protein
VAADPSDDAVPKLPRGRGITLSVPQLVRILGLIVVLVFLLVMQRPCANAVSTFVTGFDGSAKGKLAGPGSAGATGSSATGSGATGSGAAGSGHAAPGLDHYEHLRPGMTDDEVKAVIERARVKAAGSAEPPEPPPPAMR